MNVFILWPRNDEIELPMPTGNSRAFSTQAAAEAYLKAAAEATHTVDPDDWQIVSMEIDAPVAFHRQWTILLHYDGSVHMTHCWTIDSVNPTLKEDEADYGMFYAFVCYVATEKEQDAIREARQRYSDNIATGKWLKRKPRTIPVSLTEGVEPHRNASCNNGWVCPQHRDRPCPDDCQERSPCLHPQCPFWPVTASANWGA